MARDPVHLRFQRFNFSVSAFGKALLDHLYNEGCSIISTGACMFSTPMTEAEIDTLVEAFKSGFAKLASVG